MRGCFPCPHLVLCIKVLMAGNVSRTLHFIQTLKQISSWNLFLDSDSEVPLIRRSQFNKHITTSTTPSPPLQKKLLILRFRFPNCVLFRCDDINYKNPQEPGVCNTWVDVQSHVCVVTSHAAINCPICGFLDPEHHWGKNTGEKRFPTPLPPKCLSLVL